MATQEIYLCMTFLFLLMSRAFLILIDQRFLVLAHALAGLFNACNGSQTAWEAESGNFPEFNPRRLANIFQL